MGRTAKAMRLTPELRAELERLLLERSMTFLQLAEHLRSLGGDVSKSGLARYAQKREKVNERIRITREMTSAMVKDMKDLPEEDHDRALHELVMVNLVQCASNLAEQETPDTEEALKQAMAANHVAAAKKKNLESFDLRAKIRAAIEKERGEAADRVTRVSRERGLSDDTIGAIKQAVLGVGKRTAA